MANLATDATTTKHEAPDSKPVSVVEKAAADAGNRLIQEVQSAKTDSHLLPSFTPDDNHQILFPRDQPNPVLPEVHLHLPDLGSDDLKKAEDKLDGEASALLSPGDQALLKTMNHALINGDPKAFGDAISQLKGDPEKVKAFVADLQKGLKEAGADLQVIVTKDGNVVAYRPGESAGVQFNGKTGESFVVPIKTEDGNVTVGDKEVVNKTAKDVFHDLGQAAAQQILNGKWHPFDLGDGPNWSRIKPLPSDPSDHHWFKEPKYDLPDLLFQK